MAKIRVLGEEVINKIAAGEVVEKPASVVKELIENSLDAQATSITVSVGHGGKEIIRVTDNGTGMSPEDAVNSLKRYATSKIETVDDIFRIRSLGFRGEALPSIAAISRLTLLTREPGSDVGRELKIAGGLIESAREAGVSAGTSVEVGHLFFNTPARRKFLRSEKAEFHSIVDTFTTLALGNPTVEFTLIKDGRVSLELPCCQSLRERVGQIHGEEVVAALLSVQVSTTDIQISGFVTDPSVSRANRTGQHFYVNNRPITLSALSFALRHGYGEMLPVNRHPLAFLFFAIDGSRVDVNVHPSKREVRVAHEHDLQRLLSESIRQTLHTQQKFTQLRFAENEQELGNVVCERGGKTETQCYQEMDGFLAPQSPNDEQARRSCPYKLADTSSTLPFLREPGLAFQTPGKPKTPRIIGQLQATYILAEDEGALLLIDQHAAHERIVYEKLLDMVMNTQTPSQLQLLPITFSLDYREQEVMEEYNELFERLGFGINSLGRNTYSLDAIPVLLDSADPKVLLLDLIHDAMERPTSRCLEDKKKALAASIACKSRAVKASAHLLPEEMEYLVTSLFQTRQPFTCPHGRPTCITLTYQDLQKKFGRK